MPCRERLCERAKTYSSLSFSSLNCLGACFRCNGEIVTLGAFEDELVKLMSQT